MAKAVLVMDMPESCAICKLISICGSSSTCWATKNLLEGLDIRFEKPDWCPLKPMPEKSNSQYSSYRWRWFKQGWNACIDKILGKNEVKNESIKTSFRDNR